MPNLNGRSLADCGIDPARLERLQIAIGEPLRVAAELDGPIDLRAVRCLAGEPAMKWLSALRVVLRDRPGGLAIEYHQAEAAQTVARAAGADLAQRCLGAICGAATRGPPLRTAFQLGKTAHFELDGPGLDRGGAAAVVAAIDHLRATSPELHDIEVRDQRDALVVELSRSDVTASVALALALRQRLLEAFKIPSSSMIPTLQINDHVFAAKGSLAGALRPGGILVYNTGDRQYVKRYLAGPGQVIAETRGRDLDRRQAAGHRGGRARFPLRRPGRSQPRLGEPLRHAGPRAPRRAQLPDPAQRSAAQDRDLDRPGRPRVPGRRQS